jgi:2-polyprenyl-6-hydroxyphenyl methylase / 3-demethylubiquinone-9 3-methyltransferase
VAVNRNPARINNRFYEELGDRWYDDDRHPIALLRAETKIRLAYIERVLRGRGEDRARILDLGCGGGLITIPLAVKGYDIKGVDISENSLSVARKRVPKGVAITFAADNVYDLHEASAAYDVVLMMDLLEHLEDQETAVAQASRVLKPKGLLIFHTFNRNVLSYLVAITGIEVLCADSPEDIHVYQLFVKPVELSRMCARAGLRTCEFIGIRPRFFTRAFLSTLATRAVHPKFQFRFTRSTMVGYLGYAIKSEPA